MTERVVVNPFKTAKAKPDFVTMASSDTVNYSNPRSPMSNEPMVEVLCGTADGPNFKAWVSIKDRIVLPHRG